MIDDNQTDVLMKPFEKVIQFIEEEKGTDVVLKSESTCYIRSVNRLFMHFNFNMEKNGLMVLLHEVGHALQPENKQSIVAQKYEDGEATKKEVCLAIWETELDAWERGEQLAKDLNLDIDWNIFYKKMQEGLQTYYDSYIEVW